MATLAVSTAYAQTYADMKNNITHKVMSRAMAENYIEEMKRKPEKGWWRLQNTNDERWFNHLDFAIAGGSGGVGFDIAAPMTEWAQLRIGGEWRPFKTYHASFGLEVAENLSKDAQTAYFERMSDIMECATGIRPQSTVKMKGDLKMNNFKLLVDVFPLKNHRNFHVTVGFYYGNSTLVEASNTAESMRNLTIVNAFNAAYKRAVANESLIDFEAVGIDNSGEARFEAVYDKLLRWGMSSSIAPDEHLDAMTGATMHNPYFAEYGLSVPVGRYNHDIIAQEDIYWADDEYLYDVNYDEEGLSHFTDGTYFNEKFEATTHRHRKGEIRYHKGDVVHKAGDPMRVVPDDNNMVTITATANKFKPYIGAGYTIPITRDQRTQLSMDAGLLFWGGKPSINFKTALGVDADGNTVYYNVDMVRELKDLPNGVQYYVNRISHFPVFPEITLRLSQRLW